MLMKKLWSWRNWFLAVLLLTGLGACGDEGVFEGEQKLKIVRASGEPVEFKVKIARSSEELTHGLMFYHTMPARHGMLFDFGSERGVRMWMKNTLIALDMLFFDEAGRLVYIEKDAAPETLNPRGPDQTVRYVLEINAGGSEEAGITLGDRLEPDQLL